MLTSSSLGFQANAGDFVYIFYGSLDHPTTLPPKGEFFTSKRDPWMPEVPGRFPVATSFRSLCRS
jgi:hypothetical protein